MISSTVLSVTGVKCVSSRCLAGDRVVTCVVEIIAFLMPLTLSLKNIANSLHLDVEISSKASETGGFVNLFTVANRTQVFTAVFDDFRKITLPRSTQSIVEHT